MKNGSPHPIGASITATGVNFSVFSNYATGAELLLFDAEDAIQPSHIINLAPGTNRTSHYWHVHLPGIKPGQLYGYRMSGPYAPELGHRFDPEKILLDPYGRAISSRHYQRDAAARPGDNAAAAAKSVVADLSTYDWGDDCPLDHPFSRTVLYEVHVSGFTRNTNSGVAEEKRGTYAGLVEKIPYLKDLGVTAVELMPVFQFDAQDAPPGLENYWGYSPMSFFAPHGGYSSRRDPLGCLDEFRDMVKALHKAGIEVILDVVYNHTAEGGDNGPTFSFKGFDNRFYYLLSDDFAHYADYTGTGNTLNSNFSVVRRMIGDSLRYWVSEMHVDGFRFDLAAVLTRDEHGRPDDDAPILWEIDSDPVLAGRKLIAEAWDPGGLYLVGTFGGDRWKEWNGRFRDDVRRFLKSDRNTVLDFRQRLLGSPDIYSKRNQPPEQSINFVTCHDGFTLNDLFSFNQKHNEANGENNRDGSAENYSWNCGVEGSTDDAEVERLRVCQIRNAFTLNLLSVGTPMLLMGDEVRRTQLGNNNAYCQNNEVSWFDWSLFQKNAGLHRFVRLLIQLRVRFAANRSGDFLSLADFIERAKVQWDGVHLAAPDLSVDSHSLACTASVDNGGAFHLMINAYWEPLSFALPVVPDGCGPWRRLIDTYQDAPSDFLEQGAQTVSQSAYDVQPRSIVLLTTGHCGSHVTDPQ
ncbi:glycogen debranching protein GlgX [Granulicella sp. L46]|uniref:glycogen debranching protein GlgX n=1 Tax=Granulicella sp. L46 TaxID=1641865 RepID=UPI00131BCD96|nr:glycogen debranching protein GlgX [Granulicella sp. L46]